MERPDTPDGHLYSSIVSTLGVKFLDEVKIYLSDKRRINNVIIGDEFIYYFETPPSLFKSIHMGDDNIPEKSIFEYYNFKEEDIELIEFVRNLDYKQWTKYDKVVCVDKWISIENIDESKILYKKIN